jgi:ADP-ribose pyrophosphatase
MTEWETLDSELAYTCDGFDIVTESVRLPDGTETEFDYLSESESVVILPFTSAGEVVVIEEWRQAVRRLNRGLPAGSMEAGERPAAAVHRELREETGYRTSDIEHLTSVEPSNGFADAVFHYYAAYDCEPDAQQDLDTDETIDATTTTLPSLVEAVRDGELRDGRSAFGILYYKLFAETSESEGI